MGFLRKRARSSNPNLTILYTLRLPDTHETHVLYGLFTEYGYVALRCVALLVREYKYNNTRTGCRRFSVHRIAFSYGALLRASKSFARLPPPLCILLLVLRAYRDVYYNNVIAYR